MHPLAKRIALLVSIFSLVTGLFLLGYNLRLISREAQASALNLWPLLLVIAGFMLIADSTRKRAFAHGAEVRTMELPLPMAPGCSELSVRVDFSYGRLLVACATGAPRLITEQVGPASAPMITREIVGDRSEIAIAVSQPIFPAHFQLRNTWRLELPRSAPLRLSIQLHEADLHLDLRRLDTETLDLRTDSGTQELLLGRPARKLTGQIYASGSHLSLVLPLHVFARVRLLNPFCRVDYPQGDLVKREDGSLVTPTAPDAKGSVEVSVDGPLRALVLDIEDAAADPET